MVTGSHTLALASRSSRRVVNGPTRQHAILLNRYAHHGAPHYNEPSGYLWGDKPLPKGQKRRREDWELIWNIGFFGTLAVGGVLLFLKPDTSIQTWALNEAKQRMDASGEKYQYKPSS